MSYQVLARKWRPRTFSELVGQTHVVRALANALDGDRVHHAFLFTGTRGVGKTTIARILAKCLNCEGGVSSEPCGQCAGCREIDEGRFVDLIEVDAASRTKVEDTRDLLENVPYAPASGRYKVYLIDEVHMLSTHSFNALLKTLEEPPPHVKFLLATTDPHRLPVTILSRCLQFNLKRLPVDQIVAQLERIISAEGVSTEPAALSLVGVAADGSLRDALSLLDQAIAYGNGSLQEAEVRSMLGSIDKGRVFALMESLAAGDGPGLMGGIAELAEQTPDYDSVLADVVSLLQRVAAAQIVPQVADDDSGDQSRLLALTERMSPEDVQLYYQIGLLGRRDLPLAPEPRSGFEMVMLRMLAFRPDGQRQIPAPSASPADERPAVVPPASPVRTAPPASPLRTESPVAAPVSPARTESPVAAPVSPTQTAPPEDDWGAIVARLQVAGLTRELALNSMLVSRDGESVRLVLSPDHAQVLSKQREAQLQEALGKYYGAPVRLAMEIGTSEAETPAQHQTRHQAEQVAAAVEAIEADPNVQGFRDTFGATVVEGSVRPED